MTTNLDKVSCIILAGGEGKRVDGADKGLVLYKYIPLIEHVLSSIKPQVDEIVISANRNIDIYKEYGYKVIVDAAEDYKGPLAGIAAALPYCTYDRVLIVPCDMPYLSDNIVEKLSGKADKDISIVESDNKMQLVFLMHKKLLTSIQQSLESEQLRLMQWVKSHQPAVIKFADDSAFKNFNNRDDIDN